ncbi:MAG: PTS mannitol transporter subunit IICBA [Cetobacterium sp.]
MIKVKVQAFGRFLSGMVMPNIGVFIAWGLLTALFIPTGWFPNNEFAKMVEPMIKYILPLMIGYNGGKLVAGERGAIVGSITTVGVICGTSIPMFIGAMIAGPVGGYTIKSFDKYTKGKIKSGFEMLVNNFSAGIVGLILAIIFFKGVGPIVEKLNALLGVGVNRLVEGGLLPLTALVVEPAKVLFLNNAINHGVFGPLGIQQVSETGKSIFFLIESNPGPGLGVLLAYMMFGKGASKNSASGAAIIHFFGGIHEIYFPYILMKPMLIVSIIFGGITGIFINVMLNTGLVAPPSPGSIFAIMALAPRGGILPILLSIAGATGVTFITSAIILKSSKEIEEDVESLKTAMVNNKITQKISKIIVACDAGMGSSAMGASVLRKKIEAANLPIQVANCSISNLTEDIDIVITHKDLTERAKKTVSSPQHLSIDNFMNHSFYDQLIENIKEIFGASAEENQSDITDEILKKEGVLVNQKSISKDEAIKNVASHLQKLGYVGKDYGKYMLERELISTTYIGNYVAIPHGTVKGKQEVLKSGIVILQYPDGIDFGNGNIAYFLIGIAGKNDEHVEIISKIADVIEDEDEVLNLKNEKNAEIIYKAFNI